MRDWRVVHVGGAANTNDDDDDHDDDDDDDDHDGYDDDDGRNDDDDDDDKPDDEDGHDNDQGGHQDDTNEDGAGDGNFQGHGSSQNYPPGDSGFGYSANSGTSSGNMNSSVNSTQPGGRANNSRSHPSAMYQERQETQGIAPSSIETGRPMIYLSSTPPQSTLVLQPRAKQSVSPIFPGPLPNHHPPTPHPTALMSKSVQDKEVANVSSKFATRDTTEIEDRESDCHKHKHSPFTETMKSLKNNILRKFQYHRRKGGGTDERIVCLELCEIVAIVDKF
jgi:hypothetical protein